MFFIGFPILYLLIRRRAGSFSKLDNTINNNSMFNTKYAEFSTK